jgi:hypothetical protein
MSCARVVLDCSGNDWFNAHVSNAGGNCGVSLDWSGAGWFCNGHEIGFVVERAGRIAI